MDQHNLYFIDDNHGCGTQWKRRVIVDIEVKKSSLNMCHSGVDGMHLGRDKTYQKVCMS